MFKKISLVLISLMFLFSSVTSASDAFLFKRKKDKSVEKPKHQKKDRRDKILEEKKVMVVEIFASWCPGCKNIQPTLDQIAKEIPDINFVQLDVSTPSKAQESAKKAKELKIYYFYKANKSKTSTVAVIVPSSGEIVTIFQNNNEVNDYKTAIQEAQTKEKALHNPPA